MRVQLMAVTRECSEYSARCLTLKQEKKQLSERVEALAEECRALSHELTEERNNNQVRMLSAGRDVTRMRTLTRMICLDVHAKLNEAAGSIIGFLEENDALADQGDEYLSGRSGDFSADEDEEQADGPVPLREIRYS
jgi:phosphoenolpyruvate-protein kinase (PTS system EI component)